MHCPSCSAYLTKSATSCWNCGRIIQVAENPEVSKKRKAIDMMHKNPEVAKKVIDFLGIM